MSELPPGWAWATLAEITENLDRHRRPVKASERAKRPGNTPYYGATGMVDTIDGHLFDEDLLLLGEDGVGFFDRDKEKAYLISGRSWINNHSHALRVHHAMNPVLLKFYLDWFDYHGYVTGTTRLKLTKAAADHIPVPIPPPAEQRRIIDMLGVHLERLRVADRTLQQLMPQLKVLEHQLMNYSTNIGMPPAWPGPEPRPADVIDVDLPCTPSSWRWERLGDLADVVGGVTKDSKKQSDPALHRVAYLRVANVQGGYLDLTDVATLRVTDAQLDKLALRRGDILLNEGGDRDKLGRGWVWDGQIESCVHQNHVFRARLLDSVLDPRLVAWHANSYGRKWFARNGKQSVNLASVSLSTIKQFPVPIPPEDEQEQLAADLHEGLEQLRRLRAVVELATARSANLRRELLATAFSGELVDQDPTDKPADVLLARIRAEREAAEPKKTRTRKGTA